MNYQAELGLRTKEDEQSMLAYASASCSCSDCHHDCRNGHCTQWVPGTLPTGVASAGGGFGR